MFKLNLNIVTGLSSIITGFVLFIIKLYFALVSGSVSLLASTLDSAFDFVSSLINFIAIKAASKPANQKYRYGQGKAEAVAGLLQSIIIFLSAIYIAYQAISKLAEPANLKPLDSLEGGLIVMGVSFLLTLVLVLFQTYTLRKTNSLAIKADRMHYITDLLSNALVISSLIFEMFYHLGFFDLAAGLIISVYITKSSFSIFKESLNILMDKDISNKYRQEIIEYIKSKDYLYGYHDLRTRTSGNFYFLEVHIEMDKDISLEKGHDYIEEFMNDFAKRFERLEIIIHPDPVRVDKKNGTHVLLDKAEPRFY